MQNVVDRLTENQRVLLRRGERDMTRTFGSKQRRYIF